MKKAKHKSARADGRGGWVPGKRRHAEVGDWSRLQIRANAMLNDHWQMGRISYSALARALGVSDRSVRRWLSGEDRPSPEMQEMVRQWLTDRRDELSKQQS